MPQKWVKATELKGHEEFTCPKCGRPTEWLVDDTYCLAERCQWCKWTIRFDDD